MIVRKGPQGQFLIRKLTETDEIYQYALEVIEREKPSNLLPVYLYPDREYGELGFDITGLTPLKDLSSDILIRKRDSLRKGFGGLLGFIGKMEDLMLPPEKILFDLEHLFIDMQDISFRVPFCPVFPRKEGDPGGDIENVFTSGIFKQFLTPGEITDIVYALKQCDGELLEKTAAALTVKQQTTIKYFTINRHILQAAVPALGAAAALFLDLLPLALISVAFSAYILIRSVRRETEPIKIQNADRSRIFFDEKKDTGSSITLRPKDTADNKDSGRVSYLSEAIVGSDLFLSDICFDMPGISAIHAKITLRDNTYYIKDISANGETFIDDCKVPKDGEREIKDGQVLRLGDKEFTVTVEFPGMIT